MSMDVLLTNDDGITAAGLRALYRALRERGHSVLAVAPMKQQSGVGHSLTVYEPLRAQDIRDGDFCGIGVHGTPTDCVKLALQQLVDKKPDIVLSGINLGRNVGPDIYYSGTIGAAAEAAHAHIPAMAFSHLDSRGQTDLTDVGRHAIGLAEKVAEQQLLPGKVISVNYPACPLEKAKGPRLCPQAEAQWIDAYNKRMDPRGLPYWWLAGDMAEETIPPESDLDLLYKDYITITPLKFEYNDEKGLELLKSAELC